MIVPWPASVRSVLTCWLLNAPAGPTSQISHHGLRLVSVPETALADDHHRETSEIAQRPKDALPGKGSIVMQLVTQQIKDQLPNLQN